jgi:hypothetical protein
MPVMAMVQRIDDRRDEPLRHLRDVVAAAYCVHPTVVAALREETLVWMAAFRWGPLDRVQIYRVV